MLAGTGTWTVTLYVEGGYSASVPGITATSTVELGDDHGHRAWMAESVRPGDEDLGHGSLTMRSIRLTESASLGVPEDDQMDPDHWPRSRGERNSSRRGIGALERDRRVRMGSAYDAKDATPTTWAGSPGPTLQRHRYAYAQCINGRPDDDRRHRQRAGEQSDSRECERGLPR